MDVHSLLEQYYSDYLTSPFVTEEELDELVMLLGVIYNQCDNELHAPSRTDISAYITGELIPSLVLPQEPTSYLQHLRSREIPGDQRTTQWKIERMKYITASVAADCAGVMGPGARENQLLEKASYGQYCSFRGGYYTDIGNIFEPVTNSYYCIVNNVRIYDFGLIPNNKEPYTFLAASTDGVAAAMTAEEVHAGSVATLTNIEIKTLPGRVPDGKIKKRYYHQMQQQMECLGLEHTDFIEVKYDQYDSLDELRAKVGAGVGVGQPIGSIAELYHCEEQRYIYEYSPVGKGTEQGLKELNEWQQQRDKIIAGYTQTVFTRWIFWVQTHYSCIHVKRDPTWIVTMGPSLLKFYEEMVALRADQSRVLRLIAEKQQRLNERRAAYTEPDGESCLI